MIHRVKKETKNKGEIRTPDSSYRKNISTVEMTRHNNQRKQLALVDKFKR